MQQNSFHQFAAPSGQAARAAGGDAVIPLPDLGEGGPVYPGNDSGGDAVIPLPNPGEGKP